MSMNAISVDELKEDRPKHILHLCKKRPTKRSGRKRHPDCVLGEYVDVWATEQELAELQKDEARLVDFINIISEAMRVLTHQCQAMAPSSLHDVWLTACHCCDRAWDRETRGETDGLFQAQDVSDNRVLSYTVHVLLSTMEVINQFLLRDQDCDFLVLLLTPLQPNHPRRVVVPRLIQLLDTCASHFPRLAYAAATLLSLLIARRPAAVAALVESPRDLSGCCARYMERMVLPGFMMFWTRQSLHKYYASMAFLRILPLLYFVQVETWPVLVNFVAGIASRLQQQARVPISDSNERDLLEPLFPRLQHDDRTAVVLAASLELLVTWSTQGMDLQRAHFLLEECQEEIHAFHEELAEDGIDFLPALLDCCIVNSPETAQLVLTEHEDNLLLRRPMLRAQVRARPRVQPTGVIDRISSTLDTYLSSVLPNGSFLGLVLIAIIGSTLDTYLSSLLPYGSFLGIGLMFILGYLLASPS